MNQEEASKQIAELTNQARELIRQAEVIAVANDCPFSFHLSENDCGAPVGGRFEPPEYDPDDYDYEGPNYCFEEIVGMLEDGEEAGAIEEFGLERVERAKILKDNFVWTRWKSSSEFC